MEEKKKLNLLANVEDEAKKKCHVWEEQKNTMSGGAGLTFRLQINELIFTLQINLVKLLKIKDKFCCIYQSVTFNNKYPFHQCPWLTSEQCVRSLTLNSTTKQLKEN